jgi:hypothetical protein
MIGYALAEIRRFLVKISQYQVGHMQAQHRPAGRLTPFNVGNRLAQTSSLLIGIGAKSAYDSLCYGGGAD